MNILLLPAALALALAACKPGQPPSAIIPIHVAPEARSTRFRVEQVSRFRDPDAYNDCRAIFLIEDRLTGRQYVGVTGVGISTVGTHSENSVDPNTGEVQIETVRHEQ